MNKELQNNEKFIRCAGFIAEMIKKYIKLENIRKDNILQKDCPKLIRKYNKL